MKSIGVGRRKTPGERRRRGGRGHADGEAVVGRAARPDDVERIGGDLAFDDLLERVEVAVQDHSPLLHDDSLVSLAQVVGGSGPVARHGSVLCNHRMGFYSSDVNEDRDQPGRHVFLVLDQQPALP